MDSPKNVERPQSGNGLTGSKNTKSFIEKGVGRYVDFFCFPEPGHYIETQNTKRPKAREQVKLKANY
jgi:hypothetical protein